MPKTKIQENKCKVFHCDRRRGQYCCSYCDYKKTTVTIHVRTTPESADCLKRRNDNEYNKNRMV